MITVAAEALGGRWELAGAGADADFLTALVDDLEQRYCVDRNRVHLIGMSLGAWKAAVTACASGGRFASAALVTVEVFPGTCEPLPVIAFHGRADPTVPYETGDPLAASSPNAALPGAEENIAQWANSGGCDPEPELTEIGDDVELRRFEGCDLGIGVELYSIDGGGHTWPGADIDLGPAELTTDTIDATALALDWFEAHPRRG
jgi:polyhydroxybutyrate depolymerase